MRSRLIINKSAAEHNLAVIKSRLKPGVKVMAVVKDNAYGHGLTGFADTIKDTADWFCVVRIEEGIELRKNGIKKPILILEIPSENTAPLYNTYSLTATVADTASFDILADGTEYHLNFDTGMRRLGLDYAESTVVRALVDARKNIKCTGIYTHFANADADIEISVQSQLERFNALRAAFPPELMTHAANSAAVFYHNDKKLQFDAVRPGISLYGYSPGEQIPELKPLLTWEVELMQVKKIKKGEAVGYGSTWQAEEEGWLGVIPVGYGDGIPRILSGKLEVGIAGKRYRQTGRITMGFMMMFSKTKLRAGETVKIFDGQDLTPAVWANHIKTIPYEITTGLKSYIDRIYR